VTKPKALLLDLDGTLLESERLWLMAEQRVMRRYGYAWSVVDQHHCLGGPLERVADYMELKINGVQRSPIIGEELLSEVGSLFESEPLEWRPGARELVSQAHTLSIATVIVTASWRELLNTVITRMSESVGEFTHSIAGDEVENSKPHPEPYLNAAQRVGVPIGECLAIEDSPTGTLSAVRAGAKVIAVEHMAAIEVPGAIVVTTLVGHDVESLWKLVNN
jgi:HAD superfamily hydrolase (TIGR01509 family)